MNKAQHPNTAVKKNFSITFLSQNGRELGFVPESLVVSKISTTDGRSLWQVLHNN